MLLVGSARSINVCRRGAASEVAKIYRKEIAYEEESSEKMRIMLPFCYVRTLRRRPAWGWFSGVLICDGGRAAQELSPCRSLG